MAVKLPDYRVLGERPDVRSGRGIASFDTSSVGAAVAQAGGVVARIGNEAAEREDDLAEARAKSGYLVDAAGLDEQRDQINDPAALEGFRPQYDQTARKHAETIRNPRRREQFMLSVAPDVERRAIGAGDRAKGIRTDQSIASTNERLVQIREKALRSNNEAERATYIKAADDELTALERAGQIDATKAQAVRRSWTQDFLEEDTRLKRDELIRKGDYAGAQSVVDRAGGRRPLAERMIGAESGGDPNAKNPRSSATGQGQFTSSTWVATVTKHRPDLIEGRNAAEVLDLRKDPKLSREMVEAHIRDNTEYLQKAGIEPTDGNLYLAHFAGADGAERVLKANPNASVESILGEKVIKSNPFLKGMTASDLSAWANKKMGEPGGPTTLEAARWRKLDDETRTDIKAAKKATEDETRFTDILTGARDFNPYNKDDRKAVDDAFDVVGARQSVRNMDAGVVGEVSAVAQKFSYVPGPVAEELSDMVMNGSAEEKAYALQTTSAILAGSPNAMDKTDNGKALTEKSRDFEAMVRVGIKPDAAVKRIDEMATPEFQARTSALKGAKDFTAFQKARTEAELASAFDEGLFYSTPDVGSTPAERARMVADYRSLAEYHYLRTGDEKLAVSAAQVDMKRANGVSNVTGTARVMKYPPEKFYPPAGGSHSYIGAQAAKEASTAAGAPVKEGDVLLQPVRQTDEDVAAGRPPRYAVLYYRDRDGQKVLETIPGMVFRPDAKAAQDEVSTRREKEFRAGQAQSKETRGLQDLRTEMRQRARSGENVPTEEFTRRRDAITASRQGLTLPGRSEIPASPTDPMGSVTGGVIAP